MLILSFLATVLMSVLWLVYAGFYISARFAGTDFYTLGLNEVVLCVVLVFLPLFVLWGIWGRFCSLRHEMGLQKQFALLSVQNRQNQEYSDVIARLLLKNSQLQAHAFAMGKIELYIGEMNEILSDILQRCRLLKEDEMQKLWNTEKMGNRWGFAKAFVNLYNSREDFEGGLLAAAKENPLLAGSLTEFCARYTRLLGLLKVHDEENILQDVIETGVFGRVFAIFAPVVRGLYEKEPEKENIPVPDENVSDAIVLTEEERFFKDEEGDGDYDDEPGLFDNLEKEEAEPADIDEETPEKERKPFWSRLLGLHDDEDEMPNRPDPLTIALERSFGTPEEPEFKETSSEQALKPENAENNENPAEKNQMPAEIISAEASVPVSEEKQADSDKTTSVSAISEKTSGDEPAKRPVSKRFAFANTDKTIKSLQKEWEEMKKNDKAAVNAKKAEE